MPNRGSVVPPTTSWHRLKQVAGLLRLDSKCSHKTKGMRRRICHCVTCHTLNLLNYDRRCHKQVVLYWLRLLTDIPSTGLNIMHRGRRLMCSNKSLSGVCPHLKVWGVVDGQLQFTVLSHYLTSFHTVEERACRAWGSIACPQSLSAIPQRHCMSLLCVSEVVGSSEGGFDGIFHRY